ncbi:AI-2E family transporter [Sphingopyxis solisilvae]|uniref:AI-2E family transporter n=1 Tax=Sphingopyxis solisilvae TaxID=1886788 RepID=UPI001892B2C1|nr:AI-2E family transporter [Sphingopyxis solisilvae]
MTDQHTSDTEARFVRKVLILGAVAVAVGLVITLHDLLILVFGSVVIAVLLTSIANPIERWTKLNRGFALTISILIVGSTIAGAGALFGTQAAKQAQELSTQIPVAWDSVRQRLSTWGVNVPPLRTGDTGENDQLARAQAAEIETKTGRLADIEQNLLGRVGSLVMTLFGAIANILLVIAGGIYLAAQPKLYRAGLLKLLPAARRNLADEALLHCGEALRLWMLGTLVSMGLVAAVTGTGLWLLGVQSPLALGLLAGLLEFVPIVGPIAAATPAILVAFSQSPELALWTLGLFVIVQQLEGNVIQPLVQRYAVDLPPALMLFSVVAGGALFGIVGIIFAAPLTVVAFVLVKRLYVRELLETETKLPHEK